MRDHDNYYKPGIYKHRKTGQQIEVRDPIETRGVLNEYREYTNLGWVGNCTDWIQYYEYMCDEDGEI